MQDDALLRGAPTVGETGGVVAIPDNAREDKGGQDGQCPPDYQSGTENKGKKMLMNEY